MRPLYSSNSTIELNKSGSGSLGLDIAGGGEQSMSFGEGLQTDLKTEMAVLKSDSLAVSVIKRLNLEAEPPFTDKKHSAENNIRALLNGNPGERAREIGIFASRLRVSGIPGTRLIEVAYLSHDPKQAADVANEVVESYKEQYLESHYAVVSQASDWLTKQLSDLKSNVEASEKRLTDYEKSSGILTDPGGASEGDSSVSPRFHSVVLQKLDILNSELTAAETDRLQKEAVSRLVHTGDPEVVVGLNGTAVAQGSSTLMGNGGLGNLARLQLKIAQLKVDEAQASTVYGPSNRHLKDIQTQLQALNVQVHDEMQRIIRGSDAELKVAQQTENALRARFIDQQDSAARLNEKNVQLAVLTQEAYSQKKLYEDLYTKLQEANISAGIKATNVTIIDPASPPTNPVRPNRRLYLELGLLLGGLFGLGGAYLLEAVDNRITTTAEVEEVTALPVIGVIPKFEQNHRSYGTFQKKALKSSSIAAGHQDESPVMDGPWILAYPTSSSAEALRALRTSLFLSRAGGRPKVVLVTSSVPAEGKSTITANLAIAMAQHGQRTILVEADMRRPSLHQVFKLPRGGGLSNVLTETETLDDAILRNVGLAGLDVLLAGPTPPLSSELLGSGRFQELLGELRSQYDTVLIDSPPALLLSDPISIAPQMDAMLWIIRSNTATRPYLRRAAQLIRRACLPFVGFVLNDVDHGSDPYGYGYSYGYKQYGEYYGGDDSARDL